MLAPLIVHLLLASLILLLVGGVINSLFGRSAVPISPRNSRLSGMSLGSVRPWHNDRDRLRVGRLEFDDRRNFNGHRWN